MVLFFSAARLVFLGRTLKVFEEGHAVLMRRAFAAWDGVLPPEIDAEGVILGNQRADLPRKRADGTISVWGMAVSLFQAQVMPKYHHGMRQFWNHPVKTLPRVQKALYERFLYAVLTSDPEHAAARLGAALHTLQDTYTIGHTERETVGDPFSPMLRLHYSPSRNHPLISAKDRVWADAAQTELTPEAQAAVQATVAALQLWSELWRGSISQASPRIAAFVERFTPIRGRPFEPPS